jgi:hypothetical protein
MRTGLLLSGIDSTLAREAAMAEELATVNVANSRRQAVTFRLEPYGAHSLMPPGSIWTVSAQLPAGDHLAVAMDDGTIVVHVGDDYLAPVTVTEGDAIVMDYRQPAETLFDPYRSLRR